MLLFHNRMILLRFGLSTHAAFPGSKWHNITNSIVLYLSIYIYSTSQSMRFSEALLTTALILCLS